MPPTLATCYWCADSGRHLDSITRSVHLLYIALCPTADGGPQVGYDELTVANQSASARYYDTQGYRYSQLQYQQLAYSPAVTNASCIFYTFGSNFSTVDAYLTTDTNLESMLNAQASLPVQLLMVRFADAHHVTERGLLQGMFDLTKATPVAGSTISGAKTGSKLVPVGIGTYRLVIINSGGQGQTVGSTGASTQLGYRLAAYSAASGGTGLSLQGFWHKMLCVHADQAVSCSLQQRRSEFGF